MQITNKVIRRFENSILKELKGLLVQGGKKMNDVQPGIRPDGLLAGSEAALNQMRANYASGIDLFDGTLLSQSDYDCEDKD